MADCTNSPRLCDGSTISAIVFAEPKWENEMSKLGFHVVWIGSDLERFNQDGRLADLDTNETNNADALAYVALVLVTKEDEYPLGQHPNGFPFKELFFNCLKPWKWSNERNHDLLVEDSRLELNVSEYYRRINGGIVATNRAKPFSLVKARPGAEFEGSITEKYLTHVINNGDEPPGKIIVFPYGATNSEPDNCLFVLVDFWKKRRMWQFIS